jgi:L,D-transpeptidase ErfK/SrfK
MIPTASSKHINGRFLQALVTTAFVLFSSSTSFADSRLEARNAIDHLLHLGTAQKKPDDMGSIEATFSAAEQYLQQNNREMAERYYLLTIQKTRILKLSLTVPVPVQERPLPLQPENKLQTPGVSSTPDTLIPLSPAESITDPNKTIVVQTEEPSQPETDFEPESTNGPAHDMISTDKLVGNASTYTVEKNDTVRLIAAKLGVSKQQLVQMNKLNKNAMLRIGQKLRYNNRKIVPQRMINGIVINIPDRTLYYFNKGKLDVSLPVALGVPKRSEKYDWTTPTGKFKIVAKQKDPTWHVPPSIQSEMEDDCKDVFTSIPPGPANPLGKYAIKTSLPGILIHSTTKPWSIYSFASHGCIRVYPEQMEEFFKKIKVNTPGEIIYRPVKLAITEHGRVFLEVHQDAYGKSTGLHVMAMQLIEKHKLSSRVNWKKVEAVIRHKAGLAEDITL